MRIGVIASSGGSAFDSLQKILKTTYPDDTFLVVTDRACGIENLCAQNRINHTRLIATDNRAFSSAARDWFQAQGGVDLVLLFFTRLVTEEIFSTFPTFNIHPSLLPAFSGFRPLERALQKQVRFIGATAHAVDETTDGGPVVAQVTMPIHPTDDLERLGKYSYIQKVYLAVLLVEMQRRGALRRDRSGKITVASSLPASDRCNPWIDRGPLWDALLQFQAAEGVEALK